MKSVALEVFRDNPEINELTKTEWCRLVMNARPHLLNNDNERVKESSVKEVFRQLCFGARGSSFLTDYAFVDYIHETDSYRRRNR